MGDLIEQLPRELLRNGWRTRDEKYARALELWRAFDRETDAFDKSRGTPINSAGAVGPMPPWDRAISAEFAKGAMERLRRAALALEIDDDTLSIARRDPGRFQPGSC